MLFRSLFISYSWSDQAHEQWVLELATELQESGVEIILDKWDLKEGHDSVAFMEKMVTDPSIEKVIIVSDETYAKKADGRAGGVGTETQIISKEVYDQQEQDKFVAVVVEKDEEGKPFLPTYYKSRIYIDLSEPDNYSENFETLLRWIYGKPLHVKPALGKRPSFLDESDGIALGTTSSCKRAISAIKDDKPYVSGAIDEYLSIFSKNIEKFRLGDVEGDFDDAVIENVERFLPYRNEAIRLFFAIAHYCPTEENMLKLHRFFESLIPYMHRPEHVRAWNKSDFDNFRFIIHELFLYMVAIFLKLDRFNEINLLLTQQFYVSDVPDYGNEEMVGYGVFRKYLPSFDHRNQRLELNRLSLCADTLKQRTKSSGIEFRYLMQADFVLFMKSETSSAYPESWFPDTLVYVGHFQRPFEIFARSISSSYFDNVKCLLHISKPSDLEHLLKEYKEDKRRLPRWEFDSFDPASLLAYDQLATKA